MLRDARQASLEQVAAVVGRYHHRTERGGFDVCLVGGAAAFSKAIAAPSPHPSPRWGEGDDPFLAPCFVRMPRLIFAFHPTPEGDNSSLTPCFMGMPAAFGPGIPLSVD